MKDFIVKDFNCVKLLFAEENQKKADLSERIIFKAKSKNIEKSVDKSEKSSSRKDKKPSKASNSKLSFADEDEEKGRSAFKLFLFVFGHGMNLNDKFCVNK